MSNADVRIIRDGLLMLCLCRYRQRKIRCRFTYTTKQDLSSNSVAATAAAEYPTLIEDGGGGGGGGRDPLPCTTRSQCHRLTPCAEILGGGLCGNIRLPPSLQHPPEFTTNAVGGKNLLTDSEHNKITPTSLLGEGMKNHCSLEGGCCSQRLRCGQEGGERDESPESDLLDERRCTANAYDVSLSGSPIGGTLRRTRCCSAHPADCEVVVGGVGGTTPTNSGDWLKLRSNRTKRGCADIAPYYFQLDPSSPFLIPSDRREQHMTPSGKVPSAAVGMKASLENI